MMIINNPTSIQLDDAWRSMRESGALTYLPEWMRGRSDWQRCLRSSEILWQPILFQFCDGAVGSVVWFTDHDADNKTAQIHFCARGDKSRISLFRACSHAIWSILSCSALNLIYANYALDHPHAGRMAAIMGFREYARVAGNVYSVITSEDFEHGETKTETAGSR